MGTEGATLNQGMGLTQEEYIIGATALDPLKHPMWGPMSSLPRSGSQNPEMWLSQSGIVAQLAPDYSPRRRAERFLVFAIIQWLRPYYGDVND